jgi:hypothetical protein
MKTPLPLEGTGGRKDKLLILLTPTWLSPAGKWNYGLFVQAINIQLFWDAG